jgi:hypothetical protein
MKQAQMLMERFNIEQTILDEMEEEEERAKGPEPIIKKVVYERKGIKMPTWVLSIAGAVATANRCNYWYCAGKRYARVRKTGNAYIEAAGTASNLEAMELIMPWLCNEVERLKTEEQPYGLTKGEGRKWANEFKLGCASKISGRIMEARKEAAEKMKEEARTYEERYRIAMEDGDNETILELDKQSKTQYALATINTALAKLNEDEKRTNEWVAQNIKFGRGNARNFGRGGAAFQAGRRAGKRANIGGPRGRING